MRNRFNPLNSSQQRARAKVRPLRVPTLGPGPWTPAFKSSSFSSSIPVRVAFPNSQSQFSPLIENRKSKVENDSWQLQNTHGFWELSFANLRATLPQSSALFYIAFLLAHPPAEPLTPSRFETDVYEKYEHHPDFIKLLPSVWARGDRVQALKLLRQREKYLHQILDSTDAIDPVKAEALAELLDVNAQQEMHLDDLSRAARTTGTNILKSILRLYNQLALAVDAAGEPHAVIRPFARHVLLHMIIPSLKLSRGLQIPMFTYTGA